MKSIIKQTKTDSEIEFERFKVYIDNDGYVMICLTEKTKNKPATFLGIGQDSDYDFAISDYGILIEKDIAYPVKEFTGKIELELVDGE